MSGLVLHALGETQPQEGLGCASRKGGTSYSISPQIHGSLSSDLLLPGANPQLEGNGRLAKIPHWIWEEDPTQLCGEIIPDASPEHKQGPGGCAVVALQLPPPGNRLLLRNPHLSICWAAPGKGPTTGPLGSCRAQGQIPCSMGSSEQGRAGHTRALFSVLVSPLQSISLAAPLVRWNTFASVSHLAAIRDYSACSFI